MTERWRTGVWLGKYQETGQHIAWDVDGRRLARSRNVRQCDESLTLDVFDTLDVRPGNEQGPVRLRDADVVPAHEPLRVNRENFNEVPVARPVHNAPRRWQITREVFEQFGSTPNCAKCTDWQQGVRSSRQHSEQCRNRLESSSCAPGLRSENRRQCSAT